MSTLLKSLRSVEKENEICISARREHATQSYANSRIKGFTNPDPRYLANVQAYIANTKTNEEILAELIAEYSEIEPGT